MNFDGNLGSLFLPNLLQMLHKDGTDGVLHILHPQAHVRVYFEQGNIVYSKGPDKSGQLMEIMANKGLLSLEQQKEIAFLIPDDDFKLGPYLIGHNLLSLEKWQRFTKMVVEEALLKAFLMGDADFKFEGKATPIPDLYKVHINIMQLILDITRKIDEFKYIRKQIPDKHIVFAVNELEDENKTIRFNRGEWIVLSKVDGKRTVDDIIQESDLGEFAVYKILYSLITSGLIKRSEDVVLNTRGDFVDYEGILTLYTDLVRIIERNFRKEVGKQFDTVYRRCLSSLEQGDADLLEGFEPFTYDGIKLLQPVLRKLGRYPGFREGKEALLGALNALLGSLLKAMEDALGRNVKNSAIREMMAAVSFVGKHQPRSDINLRVLSALKEHSE